MFKLDLAHFSWRVISFNVLKKENEPRIVAMNSGPGHIKNHVRYIPISHHADQNMIERAR